MPDVLRPLPGCAVVASPTVCTSVWQEFPATQVFAIRAPFTVAALEPQWQREAYDDPVKCTAVAAAAMEQALLYEHAGGNLGIQPLESRWAVNSQSGVPGPTWSLEPSACPANPPTRQACAEHNSGLQQALTLLLTHPPSTALACSSPTAQWRSLSGLPGGDMGGLKAVASNHKGQVWALRDHIWAINAGTSVWGVFFLHNGAWHDYGGAKGSVSGQALALQTNVASC